MDNETSNIIYLLLVLGMLSGAFFVRGEILRNLKAVAIWAIIICAVAAISIYWEDFKNTKFYAGMVAGEGAQSQDGSVTYMRADDGHFHINAEVEGARVKFMVDTGASSIVLNQADARKIGIDVDNLRYDRIYRTANGTTRGASVMLKNIIIGGRILNNIPASVNEGELDKSLLGLAFLDRLRSYKIEGNSLVISY